MKIELVEAYAAINPRLAVYAYCAKCLCAEL